MRQTEAPRSPAARHTRRRSGKTLPQGGLRIVLAAVAALSLPGVSAAFSDMEIREKWVESVVTIKKIDCKDEGKSVAKLLDYAAILIAHNEIGEAKDVLKKAAVEARSPACSNRITESASAGD